MRRPAAVNHEQGALLSQPGAGYEEVDVGAFFRPFAAERPTPDLEVTYEITRLEFAAKALDNFAKESKAIGSRTNADNTLRRAREGKEDLSPEEEYDLVERRKKSVDSIRGLRLAAKTNFAGAVGIDVEKQQEPGKDDEPVTKVVAKDPARRPELDTGYRAFRSAYGQTRNSKKRDKRREDIAEQIAAMEADSN